MVAIVSDISRDTFCAGYLSVDGCGQGIDLGADGRAQSCKSDDTGDRDQRGGHGVFGKFKPAFILEKIRNHRFHSLVPCVTNVKKADNALYSS